jgi:UDP-N-acetylglucosamine 2-epimerase
VGTRREAILGAARPILRGERTQNRIGNPYGDGRAGERIADIVVHRIAGAARATEDWRP